MKWEGHLAWVKLDDKRATNRKLRAAGFAARGLDEAAICWSAHEETDGFISDDDLQMLASLHGCKKTQPLVDALVTHGRWKRDERKGGHWIEGYLEFNPSHADLESARKRDRERKRGRTGGGTDSARNPDGTGLES